jgi:hypothetical protein
MKLRIAALIALGAITVAAVASVASGNDHTDLTGPEKALLLIEEEIADHESNGMDQDHPVMENLLEKRQRYQELAAGPPPEEPDPERVAEILAYESESTGSYEVGLLEQCEGGLGTPAIPDEVILKCVSIPQSDDSNVVAWLLGDGNAWIHLKKSRKSGESSDSTWVEIPKWPNLDKAEFEVDGEELRVVFSDETFTFNTSEWRQAARAAG